MLAQPSGRKKARAGVYSAPPAPGFFVYAESVVFLFALLGAYVQGVTGFAMGMIMLTGVTALAPVPLSVTTAVVSLASLVNIVLSLRGHLRSIDARGFLISLLGQVPFLALGLALLTYLDAQMQALSELLLGVFIVFGCGAMMLRPVPRETRSPGWGFALAGAGGGLLAGLFAAAGPVLGWFLYRQPWPHGTIRATLLACFAVSTLVRTTLVASAGGLSLDVLRFAAISLLAVLLAALLLWRWPPALEEQHLRRGAFTLLTLSGLAIVVRAAPAVF